MEMEFDASSLILRNDDVKLTMERRNLMTFHCEQCNTVLGDSLDVCGELKCMDSILCLRVTHDVIVSDEMETACKGELAHCIHSSLKCSGCHSDVGTLIHAAPQHWDVLRSVFLLRKENISCYILNSSSMVKASTLTFDLKPLEENISQVRRQFQAQFDQMSLIKERLTERSTVSKMY